MMRIAVLLLSLSSTLSDEVTVQEFTSANNLFASAVYKEIIKRTNDSFLVSPFSAETVLALSQAGARNQTAKEIQASLYLPVNQKTTESAVKQLLPALTNDRYYSLETANKIYVRENYQIYEDFKRIASDVFYADVENINFFRKSEAAETINEWVEKRTKNKIHNLINPETLNHRTRAILINALYFKANWSSQFQTFFTAKKDFYKTANSVVQVDMMHEYEEPYNYYHSQELNSTFLEVPFNGGDASMVIVLPDAKDGLATLEQQTDKVFAVSNFSSEIVNVALPKFKIQTKIEFKGILSELGIRKAFNDQQADFSGIAGKKGDLFIQDVVQKTFIDLNEGGVEAAAATYIIKFVPRSGITSEPKNFIADHPFIFYIRIKGLIVFAGRVLEPHY